MQAEELITSGRVLTIKQYFEENPQLLLVINGNTNRKGVIVNGLIVEIGSEEWKVLENKVVFKDEIFQEIREIIINKK